MNLKMHMLVMLHVAIIIGPVWAIRSVKCNGTVIYGRDKCPDDSTERVRPRQLITQPHPDGNITSPITNKTKQQGGQVDEQTKVTGMTPMVLITVTVFVFVGICVLVSVGVFRKEMIKFVRECWRKSENLNSTNVKLINAGNTDIELGLSATS